MRPFLYTGSDTLEVSFRRHLGYRTELTLLINDAKMLDNGSLRVVFIESKQWAADSGQ